MINSKPVQHCELQVSELKSKVKTVDLRQRTFISQAECKPSKPTGLLWVAQLGEPLPAAAACLFSVWLIDKT